MEQRDMCELLAAVAAGEIAPEEAAVRLRTDPFSDLGFAKVDHHRGIRQGASEVIYGAGKTPDQIAAIIANMLDAGQERVLVTRLAASAAVEVERLLMEGLAFEEADGDSSAGKDVRLDSDSCSDGGADPVFSSGSDSGSGSGSEPDSGSDFDSGSEPDSGAARVPVPASEPDSGAACVPVPAFGSESDAGSHVAVPELPVFTYYDLPQLATVGEAPVPDGAGTVVVACGGTSDIYVAEEAAVTAEMMGNEVVRLYDVGVAGLHRLLAHAQELARASVVIAVAGMEGALPSVIGGLVSCPVIAVPTSVGYGASFNGAAALLAMLNSCASGVSVVNIDNGFGAGYQASLINHVQPMWKRV